MFLRATQANEGCRTERRRGDYATGAWVTHHKAQATHFSGNTSSQQFQKWLFHDIGACLLELADLVAEEGLGDLTLWVPYGTWLNQGKESRQDGSSCSLEIGKCGPRTMGQQALGSYSSCLSLQKTKRLATVEEEEPRDGYTFVVCISGQRLLSQT